jgi:hypothetical protein
MLRHHPGAHGPWRRRWRGSPPGPGGAPVRCRLSGLEPLNMGPELLFVNVGERTNVTGSRRFRSLIQEDRYEGRPGGGPPAGAGGRPDPGREHGRGAPGLGGGHGPLPEPGGRRAGDRPDPRHGGLLPLGGPGGGAQADPGEGGGELHLPEGRRGPLPGAGPDRPPLRRRGGGHGLRRGGAGGTLERKVEICNRAYRILTREVGFPPEDIIFDPNIFAIATGIPEHDGYGVAFLEAVRRIKAELPHALTSGGVSNLSFSFRGSPEVREALHAVFLYHAIQAGLDMGIVNAGALPVLDEIPGELREACEDLLFQRRPDATERMTALAERYRGGESRREEDLSWREAGPPGAPPPRPGPRDRRVRGGGRGGGPDRCGAGHPGHRGAPHGRDEPGGGPLRGGEDVPPPGGEERPGHEEGGGPAHPPHRGGDGGGPGGCPGRGNGEDPARPPDARLPVRPGRGRGPSSWPR